MKLGGLSRERRYLAATAESKIRVDWGLHDRGAEGFIIVMLGHKDDCHKQKDDLQTEMWGRGSSERPIPARSCHQ